MRVYRIEREKRLETALEGIGASLSDGFRWNSKNTQIVYSAESRSLAVLEIAVHLDLSEDLPNDRYIVEIDIPDEIEVTNLDIEDLPANWDMKPPTSKTQYIGDDFAKSKISAVLKVPSCIIQQEFNYLINPHHPDSEKIKVISANKLLFDERFNNDSK
jgi:RES domain-containing protein